MSVNTYDKILTKGPESALPSSFEEGKLRFTTDTGRLFLDGQNDRTEVTDFVKGLTEDEIKAQLAPLTSKIYVSSDTNKLFYYSDNKWNIISDYDDITNVEPKSVSGNPIVIEDAASVNTEALKVSWGAQQDLHGYDYSWIGGSGSNKYNDSTKFENYMILSSGILHSNDYWDTSDYIPASNGKITLSWDTDHQYFQAKMAVYDSSKNFMPDAYSSGESPNKKSWTFTVPENAAYVRFSWSKNVSGTPAPRTNIRVNIGDSDLGYEPYENICPIHDLSYVNKNSIPITLENLKTLNTEGTWNDNVYNIRGVNIYILSGIDGLINCIRVNGKNTGLEIFFILGELTIDANTTILLNGAPKDSNRDIFKLRIGGQDSTTFITEDVGNGCSYTPSVTTTVQIQVYVASNKTVTYKDFFPMVRRNLNDDNVFAPYSTESIITLSDNNENLFNINNTINGYFVNQDGSIVAASDFKVSDYMPVEPNSDYTLSYYRKISTGSDSTTGMRMAWYDKNKRFLYRDGDYETYTAGIKYQTYTSPENAKYARVSLYCSSTNTEHHQFEKGSTYTDYKEYKNPYISIKLGQTIYGASIDYNIGKCIIDRIIIDKSVITSVVEGSDGDENWLNVRYVFPESLNVLDGNKANNHPKIIAYSKSKYSGLWRFTNVNNTIHWYSSTRTINAFYPKTVFTTLEDYTTYYTQNGVQFILPLSVLIELTLTPAQLKLLKGHNRISTNGDIIDLTYQTNSILGETKEYTDSKISKVNNNIDEMNTNLTNLDSFVRSKIFYTKTKSNIWYKIGTYTVPSSRYCLRYIMITINGYSIKTLKLRATPENGFNNNETEIYQLIHAFQTQNLGIIISEDKLTVDIYIKSFLYGEGYYSILSDYGELNLVNFYTPVETNLTDEDMDKIN